MNVNGMLHVATCYRNPSTVPRVPLTQTHAAPSNGFAKTFLSRNTEQISRNTNESGSIQFIFITLGTQFSKPVTVLSHTALCVVLKKEQIGRDVVVYLTGTLAICKPFITSEISCSSVTIVSDYTLDGRVSICSRGNGFFQ
jgi:hypothetical protein